MLISLLSCTNKKTLEAGKLLMRNYVDERCPDHLEEIARQWRSDLLHEQPRKVIRDLYSGSWSIIKEGVDQSLVPQLSLVISAGLGLVGLDERYPGYSSTFSSGQPDSILGVDCIEEARLWWSHLGGPVRLWAEIERTTCPRIITAIPKTYLSIIQPQLEQFVGTYGPENLAVIVSTTNAIEFPSLQESLVIVDSRMTGFRLLNPPKNLKGLGGTVGEITMSTWKHFVQTLKTEADFTPHRLRQELEIFAPFLKCQQKPNGQSLTLEELDLWIRTKLNSSDPPHAATPALRMLRNEGFACEQKKFGQRFNRLKREIDYGDLFGS